MGGRGGTGGGVRAIIGTKETVIKTTYYSIGSIGGSRFKNQVLEAKADKNGNVTFSYASGKFSGPSAKTNKTQDVTYKLKAGAVDGKTFGINWSKVNSISGETYSVKSEAKAAGLKWDGASKSWRRK